MTASSRPDDFATTQWSLVLRAAGDDVPARASIERLCQTYWLPLYAYVRRRTRDASEAQDLTQEFFAQILEKGTLAAASPERGKFRAFLLTAIKHFLIKEYDKANALKRGGGRMALSLDWQRGEARYANEPADGRDPERLFERQWALTMLETALSRLAAEWTASGKQTLFDRLQPFLTGDGAGQYAEIATELTMTEGALRQTVSRMRKRYRELLREEVAATLDEGEDIDEELERLFAALAG